MVVQKQDITIRLFTIAEDSAESFFRAQIIYFLSSKACIYRIAT